MGQKAVEKYFTESCREFSCKDTIQFGSAELTSLSIGGTGHIGGAVIELLLNAHPQLTITALVRDEDKADRLKSKYPQIETVIGHLDSAEILETHSKDSEIVISKPLRFKMTFYGMYGLTVLDIGPDHTHEIGIASILKGLRADPKSKYYIHTAGKK